LWLTYFARTVLEAQGNTIRRVDFYVAKAKFYERLRDRLNERQDKVIARMFKEDIDGFKGGLSAEKEKPSVLQLQYAAIRKSGHHSVWR
jgi:hypothetical protein